jgi:hypothetical protein
LCPKPQRMEQDELEIAHAAWLDIINQLHDESDEIKDVLEVDDKVCEEFGAVPSESWVHSIEVLDND